MINKENYEAFLLDAMEGNLSEGDHERLDAFLAKHPSLQPKELDLDQTRIIPEETIVFERKNKLMKQDKTVRNSASFRWAVAAAVISLVMIFGWLIKNGNQSGHQPEIAGPELFNGSLKPSLTKIKIFNDLTEDDQVSDEIKEPYPPRIISKVKASETGQKAMAKENYMNANNRAMEKMVILQEVARLEVEPIKIPILKSGLSMPEYEEDTNYKKEKQGRLDKILASGASMGLLPEVIAEDYQPSAGYEISGIIIEMPEKGKAIFDRLLKN